MDALKRSAIYIVVFLVALTVCFSPSSRIFAAEYPTKPVTIIVPFGAGSLSFMIAQMIGDEMGKRLGQRFLVVTKPGGTGSTGSLFAKNARPDGYTILETWIGPMVMVPIRNPKLKYDPLKDFEFLAQALQSPVVALALKDAPYNTLKEFVEYVKKHPNRIFKAGSGGAMSLHGIYAAETFHDAGIKVQNIYYQASSKSLPDLLGGNLDITFSTFMALAQYDELKALGVFSAERIPEFGSVPTAKEQGFTTPVAVAWCGFSTPVGIPPEVKTKLVSTFKDVLTDEKVKKKMFSKLNMFVVYRGPEEFRAIVERDLKAMRDPVMRIVERQKTQGKK